MLKDRLLVQDFF